MNIILFTTYVVFLMNLNHYHWVLCVTLFDNDIRNDTASSCSGSGECIGCGSGNDNDGCSCHSSGIGNGSGSLALAVTESIGQGYG